MDYYTEDVVVDINKKIQLNSQFDEWYIIVKDILQNREFQKRKLFLHHRFVSVWEHSITVSFRSFLVARYFNADKRICAIAGLLHDFYPKAWIYNTELSKIDNGIYLSEYKKKKPLFKRHGFMHAKEAALNYIKFFPELENEKVTDAIKKHMFPLNLVPPRYIEGYVITIIDKVVSLKEIFK